MFKANLGNLVRAHLEIKDSYGFILVAEHLPGMYRALNSISSTKKKKSKEGKKERKYPSFRTGRAPTNLATLSHAKHNLYNGPGRP